MIEDQVQAEQGFQKPDVVKDVPVQCREAGLDVL